MLEVVMRHIRNYFIRDHRIGNFTISDGMISPHDFLLEGQRFYVTGSLLNDGVYTYHADGVKNDLDSVDVDLKDESFAGTVFALAVPPTFIALVQQIVEWVGKFGDVANSPYQSESFNGYSYTKASGGAGSGASGGPTWQDVFRSQLNEWRKVTFL